MAEISGRYLVDACDMRFTSVRIGTFSGESGASSLHACNTLLTPRDCAQLFGLAVGYKGPMKYLITYGTSGSAGDYQLSFLDISGVVEMLSYRPQDNLIKTHLHKFVKSPY